MKAHDTFASMFEEAQKSETYLTERVLLEFTEEVVGRMAALEISRAELARRMDAKPTYVTRVLNGTNNFTVDSMVRIAKALDCSLRVHMQPRGAKSHWLDYFETQRPVDESFDIKAVMKEYRKPTCTTETPNEDLAVAS